MSTERATIFAYTRPLNDGGHTRLVNRTTLDLVKALRYRGSEVVIEPDDGTPVHYLVRKGEPSLLADPVIALLANIPISVAASLFANWLYDRYRGGDRQTPPSCVVLRIDHASGPSFYSAAGAPVSPEAAERVMQLLREFSHTLIAIADARAAGDGRFPVCVEHTSHIAGWAELSEDAIGLRMSAEITDSQTWRRIRSGELRGVSIGGIATRSECSICGADYSECPHISGVEYDGQMCINTIKRVDVAEVSLVREPVNQDCLLDLSFRDA